MKKIIAGTIVGCALMSSAAFADESLEATLYAQPVSISAEEAVPTLYAQPISISETSTIKDLIKKYEIVIRNNRIEADFEYNSQHYYTSKINTEDLIVPEEIQETAKRIYLLVEEGSGRIFFADEAVGKGGVIQDEVKKVNNYREVEFKAGQEEYVFLNEDLVKDFGDDEFKNVHITLMAEMEDGSQHVLSNTAYVSLANKTSTLSTLLSKKREEGGDMIFGYYNTNDLEVYLEEISEKMTRPEYKKMLEKASKKISSTHKANEDVFKKILASINNESDFSKNLDKYQKYTETRSLLENLQRAVRNQLQNIRAFDAIDTILK